ALAGGRALRDGQDDREDAALVRGVRVRDVDVRTERHLPPERPVADLHLLINLPLDPRPNARSGEIERALGDEEIDLVAFDAGDLDDDGQRVFGAKTVDVRAETGSQSREAGHLPEIGKELLDLLLELVRVPLSLHDADKRTRA